MDSGYPAAARISVGDLGAFPELAPANISSGIRGGRHRPRRATCGGRQRPVGGVFRSTAKRSGARSP